MGDMGDISRRITCDRVDISTWVIWVILVGGSPVTGWILVHG